MMRAAIVLLTLSQLAAMPARSADERINYLPSLMYGHILAGSGASRYETILVIRSAVRTRAHVEVFAEDGKPLTTSFSDQQGDVAATAASFDFVVQPGRTVQLKLQLPEDEASSDIAVKTGWATIRSFDDLEVSALVRILTAEGRLLSRHVLSTERLTRS